LLISAVLFDAAAAPDGAAIFAARCVPCHQADATGAIGLAPPLAGTLKNYPASADGKQYLSQIAVSGMVGRIESQGHSFVGLMPSFKADLSDAEIAAVVNYVLGHFNGVAGAPISTEAVAAARQAGPTPTETRKLRDKIKASEK
jgi:mono/diheme cytochrome c family protein